MPNLLAKKLRRTYAVKRSFFPPKFSLVSKIEAAHNFAKQSWKNFESWKKFGRGNFGREPLEWAPKFPNLLMAVNRVIPTSEAEWE